MNGIAAGRTRGNLGLFILMLAILSGVVAQEAWGDWPGTRFIPFEPAAQPEAHLTAVPPDGKIVLAGAVEGARNDYGRLAIARLHPDGSLDKSFGEAGLSVIRTRDLWAFSDIEFQPDGGIVLLGIGSGTFGIIRLNPDGSLDRSFADRGMATHPGLLDWGVPWGEINVDEVGRITYAGMAYFKSPKPAWQTKTAVIWRLDPDGKPDRTLGGTGFITRTGAWSRIVLSGRSRPDGSVLAVGASRLTRRLIGGYARFGVSLMQMGADGKPDRRFGKHGIKPLKGLYSFAPGGWSIRTCSPGRARFDHQERVLILATCSAVDPKMKQARNFGVLLRYLPSGSPDASFANDGSKLLPGRRTSVYAGIALGPGGSVTIGGADERTYNPFLTRVDEDGRTSSDFGPSGFREYRGWRRSFSPVIAVDSRGWTYGPLNVFKSGAREQDDRGWVGVVAVDRFGRVGKDVR